MEINILCGKHAFVKYSNGGVLNECQTDKKGEKGEVAEYSHFCGTKTVEKLKLLKSSLYCESTPSSNIQKDKGEVAEYSHFCGTKTVEKLKLLKSSLYCESTPSSNIQKDKGEVAEYSHFCGTKTVEKLKLLKSSLYCESTPSSNIQKDKGEVAEYSHFCGTKTVEKLKLLKSSLYCESAPSSNIRKRLRKHIITQVADITILFGKYAFIKYSKTGVLNDCQTDMKGELAEFSHSKATKTHYNSSCRHHHSLRKRNFRIRRLRKHIITQVADITILFGKYAFIKYSKTGVLNDCQTDMKGELAEFSHSKATKTHYNSSCRHHHSLRKRNFRIRRLRKHIITQVADITILFGKYAFIKYSKTGVLNDCQTDMKGELAEFSHSKATKTHYNSSCRHHHSLRKRNFRIRRLRKHIITQVADITILFGKYAFIKYSKTGVLNDCQTDMKGELAEFSHSKATKTHYNSSCRHHHSLRKHAFVKYSKDGVLNDCQTDKMGDVALFRNYYAAKTVKKLKFDESPISRYSTPSSISQTLPLKTIRSELCATIGSDHLVIDLRYPLEDKRCEYAKTMEERVKRYQNLFEKIEIWSIYVWKTELCCVQELMNFGILSVIAFISLLVHI
ncbi:hypothetical protein RF11_15489 [Thelohanellus kitauei]|uniref:Uncharacterized protein n=1 Tax=Thelohanellus kitauei TaxID=669202 RepID=A0A0C2MLX0_THEKT|nr:hypothetical protein RF11_15489 [Thelohanellus kitauei]